MLIEATRDDIEHGIRRSCFGCPIARAIKRATGRKVVVDDDRVLVLGNDLLPAVRLPKAARDFIRKFDSGGTPEPFEFELPLELPVEGAPHA